MCVCVGGGGGGSEGFFWVRNFDQKGFSGSMKHAGIFWVGAKNTGIFSSNAMLTSSNNLS